MISRRGCESRAYKPFYLYSSLPSDHQISSVFPHSTFGSISWYKLVLVLVSLQSTTMIFKTSLCFIHFLCFTKKFLVTGRKLCIKFVQGKFNSLGVIVVILCNTRTFCLTKGSPQIMKLTTSADNLKKASPSFISKNKTLEFPKNILSLFIYSNIEISVQIIQIKTFH